MTVPSAEAVFNALCAAERRLHPGPPMIVDFDPFVRAGWLPADDCRVAAEHFAAFPQQPSVGGWGDGAASGVSLVEAVYAGDRLAAALVADVADVLAGFLPWRPPVPLWCPSGQVVARTPGSTSGIPLHADGALSPVRPWVGVIVALSDGYDGGEFRLAGAGWRRHGVGDVVVVPGHVPHEVAPVTAGVRWAASLFLTPATVETAVSSGAGGRAGVPPVVAGIGRR